MAWRHQPNAFQKIDHNKWLMPCAALQISYEKFVSDEEREMTSDDPNKQNLAACIKVIQTLLNFYGCVCESSLVSIRPRSVIGSGLGPHIDEQWWYGIAVGRVAKANCELAVFFCNVNMCTGYRWYLKVPEAWFEQSISGAVSISECELRYIY